MKAKELRFKFDKDVIRACMAVGSDDIVDLEKRCIAVQMMKGGLRVQSRPEKPAKEFSSITYNKCDKCPYWICSDVLARSRKKRRVDAKSYRPTAIRNWVKRHFGIEIGWWIIPEWREIKKIQMRTGSWDKRRLPV